MRKTTLLCAALFAASAAMADLYVDASASPGVADGTFERPYATIQAAVNAAESGTTIHVAEGIYSEGAVDTSSGSGGKSAVCITNKTLRLVGAGRGKSVIAGSRDPAAPNAYSDYAATSATRCIFAANADGTIIEGFTLRDGETLTTGTSPDVKNAGGGLYADSTDVYLVDCDVVHCAGKYGSPIYKGTAVRCLFDDNYGTGGPGGRSCRLVNCVVSRSAATGGSTATLYDSTLYNCTVVDNSSTWALQQSSDSAYNSVLILSSYQLIYRETNKVDAVVENCVLGSTAPKKNLQIMGPAVADWRLLPDSDAIGAGDPACLSALDLPDGIDAFRDFTGAEIKADGNGRINAGAVQTSGVPAAGALYFQSGAVEVNGRSSSNKANVTWVFPDAYPTQYCVKAVLNDDEELYRLLRYNPFTGASGDLEYPSTVPQLDGKMWLMPPVETELAVTNSISKAAAVFWVDAARGSDEWGETVQDAGSTNHPFATIQRAVDAADSATRTVVKVMPGDYSSGVVTTNATCGKFQLHVDGKNMRIIAVEGPGNTFIRGAPDPDTGGLGTGAVKCAYLYGRNVYLQGFTLADGYSEGSDSTSELKNGAAVYSFNGSYRSTVMDCVITNCDSSGYPIMQAYLCRDRIFDCRSEDAVIVKTDGPLWGCYLRGNYVGLGGTGRSGLVSTDGARIYNSTFVGAVGEGRVCSGATISYNSIWDGGQSVYSTCVFTNSIAHNYRTTYVDASTFSNADPLFVSRERDGVLRSDSPAVGMGGEVRADNFGTEYWRYAVGDVNGEPLVFTGGRPTIGAFQKTRDFVQVTATAPANGGWGFADGAAFGTIVVPEGEAIGIVPADGVRPCIGVSCGGVDYLFTNAPNETISLDFDTLVEAGAGVSIAGIYSTDWYVDDDGDDGASGFLPTHPKKTLATAGALLAAGDTLWVFPGTYKEGSAFHTAKAIASRVVVKDGRSVISLEGAERTIIQGSAASEEYRTNAEGSGTNAVRCAYVGKGALLSGFTLTGGRTWTNNTAEAYADGSAVIGNSRGSGCVVANCIISNNIAYMGTIYKADVFHSLIIGNKAFSAGSAIRQANAYDCCISGNIGASVISYARDIWGCTVAGDNKTISGTTPTLLGNTVNDGAIFNSLFMGRLAISQSGEDYSAVSNCVFDIGSTFNDHVSTGNVFAVDRSTQSYEGGLVPVAGANVAVDAANESLCTNLYADADLRGFQRVMNGRRDIGAYEADWRSRYAADLGRDVSVVDVAPFVEEVDGMVTIRSGAMSVVVSNASGTAVKYCLPVRVTGTGTLLVEAGEEPARSIEAGDGNVMLEFVCEGDSMPIVFAYLPGEEDGGRAILGRFVRAAGGFVLTVR